MGLQKIFTQVLFLGLALVVISYEAEGSRRSLASENGATVFDVTENGAIGDGKKDNAMIFIRTWNLACQSDGAAKMLIPPGDFMTGEMIFSGPCKGPTTFELQGTLLGTVDISAYANGQWIQFQKIDRLLITGKGTFNGQGPKVWQYDGCKGKSICPSLLPPSLVFSRVNNSVMEQITSLDAKGFHIKLNDLSNFTVQGVTITAPDESPNTDGIHTSGSDNIIIRDSNIGTGDDCISIGEGTNNATVSGIFCGPGHGISVGSLGYRKDDKDVVGVSVTNCTFSNTTNGARIKTWHESPPLKAASMVWDNLVMNMVKNPITIDQHYGAKGKQGQSNVKISDIKFTNIRGTTISNNGISFLCSSAVPCDGIVVTDVDLSLVGNKNTTFASSCDNAKATFSGKTNPGACGSSTQASSGKGSAPVSPVQGSPSSSNDGPPAPESSDDGPPAPENSDKGSPAGSEDGSSAPADEDAVIIQKGSSKSKKSKKSKKSSNK